MPTRTIILAVVLLMTGGPDLDFDGTSWMLGLAPGQAIGAEGNTSLVAKVKNAPANTWIEIPNSALMRVAPRPGQFPKTWAVCGPSSVVMAWCGAAFDSKRDRLVVWGGGHADYHGNELYAFDVRKMAWKRLTDPFPNPVKNREVNADGTPNSRHTYGGLAYLAHADRFFALGGSLAGVGFAKCDRTWTYDFDAKKWADRQPDGKLPGGGFCMGCAYDPVSKKLFFGSSKKGLFTYDYDKNTWAKLDDGSVAGLGFAVDTKRKLLVGAGRGRLVVYDIGRNNFKQQSLKIPGGKDIVHAGNAAGLDYDPVADRMVGWAAWVPGKVYALDLAAKKWETRQADGGPKVTRFARNGVFGRWRYVASLNAFIAVSDAGGNVFFYKHTATEKNKLDPYCPVRNITVRYPPIVMIHGTADTDVPCRESLDMAEQLKKSKVRYEMFAIPGAGHGLGGGDRRLVDKAMARARKFIQQHLTRNPTRPAQAKSAPVVRTLRAGSPPRT